MAGQRRPAHCRAGNGWKKPGSGGRIEQTRRLSGRDRGSGLTKRVLKDQYWEAAENGDEREMARLQGREPGVHVGPHNLHRELRGEESDRLADALDAQDRNRVRVIEAELTRVEQQIRELKEIYDRTRAAIDKRLEQVGRAIRAGADAVVRAGARACPVR